MIQKEATAHPESVHRVFSTLARDKERIQAIRSKGKRVHGSVARKAVRRSRKFSRAKDRAETRGLP